MLFLNRTDAGRKLARYLMQYSGQPDLLVLALPRGGVPVAFEVAQALHAPLDVLLVRKLGVPGQEELAMGAIASGGVFVLNSEVVQGLEIPRETIDQAIAQEQAELTRRERLYRGDRPAVDVRGRTIILIDDGLATGSTMRAAVQALRRAAPRAIVCAVPVAASATCAELGREVDELVCIRTPEPFHAVGLWYEDFSQVSDAEVRELLDQSAAAVH